ncbi:YybH family protein [Rufibacter psychrotolerans]|uniref:YybH family protein n=1 Tax=Rufibacter psychrotolerans TaxID=2812556 RepID=UPI0019679520|nr:SgcJ/EcaC family oxidoreductase [Rufibacter sp. SYSU D00308]
MEALSLDITDEIKNLNQKLTTAFNQGDTAGVASLYTKTAQLLPAGSDTVVGREAIGQFWQNALNGGIKGMTLDTVEVEELEQTAIELGLYTLTGEAGQPLDQGKYMAVWKKENGAWKMQKDIWNSNQPT